MVRTDSYSFTLSVLSSLLHLWIKLGSITFVALSLSSTNCQQKKGFSRRTVEPTNGVSFYCRPGPTVTHIFLLVNLQLLLSSFFSVLFLFLLFFKHIGLYIYCIYNLGLLWMQRVIFPNTSAQTFLPFSTFHYFRLCINSSVHPDVHFLICLLLIFLPRDIHNHSGYLSSDIPLTWHSLPC
jgi:hypothetical protein